MKIANGLDKMDISATVMGSVRTIHPTLIWDEENVILVDAGFPGQLTLIQAAVENAGASFERLDRVILTHHDIDHIGSLASLQKALPGQITVLAHEAEKAYIEGTKTPLKLALMEANLDTLPAETRALYENLKTAFQNSRVSVDQTLTDGQELPLFGGITVIHTPGHTLGHICLYHRASQTLIAGDALSVQDGKLAMAPAQNNFDLALCRVSLKKLAAYDIQSVICYHGGLYQDHPNEHIAAIADAK